MSKALLLGESYILIDAVGDPEVVRAARPQLRNPTFLLRPQGSSLTYPKVLIGDSVDWKWVLRWLETCTKDYTNYCTPLPRIFELDHFRVIDVQRRCIMNAPENCAYVTLSYAWGAPKYRKLILTKANIKRLEQPNALSNQILPGILTTQSAPALLWAYTIFGSTAYALSKIIPKLSNMKSTRWEISFPVQF